jgi:DNA-binding transcriptional ArsR family regulator
VRDNLQSDVCARYLKALGDPDRLRIVQCLQTGPKNVSEITALLAAEIANVSHHLRVLREAKLVHDDKQGKYVFYSLAPEFLKGMDTLDLGCCRIELGNKIRLSNPAKDDN